VEFLKQPEKSLGDILATLHRVFKFDKENSTFNSVFDIIAKYLTAEISKVYNNVKILLADIEVLYSDVIYGDFETNNLKDFEKFCSLSDFLDKLIDGIGKSLLSEKDSANVSKINKEIKKRLDFERLVFLAEKMQKFIFTKERLEKIIEENKEKFSDSSSVARETRFYRFYDEEYNELKKPRAELKKRSEKLHQEYRKIKESKEFKDYLEGLNEPKRESIRSNFHYLKEACENYSED
jgi:transcriptional regulator with PAS, ATPase and Fis domain